MKFDLDDAFDDLMRRAYPDVPQYTVQYIESRRIFYAGAAAIFYHTTMSLASLSDDEAEAGLADVQKQIDGFFKERIPHDKD